MRNTRPGPLILVTAAALAALLPAGCRGTGSDVRFAPRIAAIEHTTRSETDIRMRQNIPFVNVRINEQGPFLFALDTGANVTVLSEHLVEELTSAGAGDRRRYRGSARGAAGDVVHLRGVFHIRSLTLAHHTFDDFHAAVIDMTPVREALGHDVCGILGFSLFSQNLVTIDYPASKLIIEHGELPEPDDTDIVEFGLVDGLPVVSVDFEGRPVSLVVDTGSDHAFAVPHAVADDLRFDQEPAPGPMAATIGGVSRRLVGRLAGDAGIGSYRVLAPEVMITAGRARMGGEVLRNFVVTFDQRNGALRLAESALAPISSSSAGALTSADVGE